MLEEVTTHFKLLSESFLGGALWICETFYQRFYKNMGPPDIKINKPIHRNNRFPVLQLAYQLCQTGFSIFSYISLTPISDLLTSKISTNMQKSFLSTGRAHGSVSKSSDPHREGADLIPGWSRLDLWCTKRHWDTFFSA